MLDALVVAPHPDDAELGMGGTIVRLIAAGLEGRHPRPDQRRADAAGLARAAGGRDRRGERGAGQPLAEEPRAAQPQPRADAGPPPRPGRRLPPGPAAAPLRPLLGRRPPRPHRGDQARRGRAVLEQAVQVRHPRRARSTRRGFFYYFSVHLRIVERPSFVIDISDQLEAKVAALRCYRSQLVDNQPEGRPGVIDSVCDRTRFWGHWPASATPSPSPRTAGGASRGTHPGTQWTTPRLRAGDARDAGVRRRGHRRRGRDRTRQGASGPSRARSISGGMGTAEWPADVGGRSGARTSGSARRFRRLLAASVGIGPEA